MERMTESRSSKKEVMPDRRRIAVLGRCLLLSATCLLAASPAAAQLAEKPSVYTAKRLGEKMVPASAALAPPPADARPVANTSGHRPAPKAGGISHLDAVASMDQFLGISRVYNADSAEPIVHTIFAIDRAHGNRVYFINANRYALHEDFLRGQFLVPHLDEITLKSYYQRPDRRFLLGTIGLQPQLKRWTFEFWEGDQVNEALIQLASQRLAASFFQPLLFKANSTQHETVAKAAGIELVTEAHHEVVRSLPASRQRRATLGRARQLVVPEDQVSEAVRIQRCTVRPERVIEGIGLDHIRYGSHSAAHVYVDALEDHVRSDHAIDCRQVEPNVRGQARKRLQGAALTLQRGDLRFQGGDLVALALQSDQLRFQRRDLGVERGIARLHGGNLSLQARHSSRQRGDVLRGASQCRLLETQQDYSHRCKRNPVATRASAAKTIRRHEQTSLLESAFPG